MLQESRFQLAHVVKKEIGEEIDWKFEVVLLSYTCIFSFNSIVTVLVCFSEFYFQIPIKEILQNESIHEYNSNDFSPIQLS